MKHFFLKLKTSIPSLFQIALVLVTMLVIVFFFPEKKHATYQFKEGSYWRYDDLLSPFPFAVAKSAEDLAKEYEEVSQDQLLFFKEDTEASQKVLKNIRQVFAKEFLPYSDAVSQKRWQEKILTTIPVLYARGILENSALEEGYAENRQIIILQKDYGEQRNFKDFYTLSEAEAFIRHVCSGISNEDSLFVESQVISAIQPNILWDTERTEQELKSKLDRISTTQGMVSTDELIISKGELVTKEKYLKLISLENENKLRFASGFSEVNRQIGDFLLLAIAFIGLFLSLRITRHPILDDVKKIVLALFVILLLVFITGIIYDQNELYVLLSPICLGPIIFHVFFDNRAAMYIHLTTIFIIGSLLPNGFEFVYYQVIAGIFTIVSLKSLQKRAGFFRTSLVIFCVYSLVYVGKSLMQDTHLHNIEMYQFLIFLLNAFITMLAYPMIYLLEKMFGLVSQVSLLELSGTNSPALRELAIKAPGTFQHSVRVSNMAEEVINELGGNANLTRVGALYHDIGKMNSAMYFTENQITGFNPHDELSSEESAEIITGHVPDGVELAHKYRIPEVIIDFIRTHHGTTKTGYFYSKQKQEFPNQSINNEVFTYRGPKPFSKENAVVMLVDSVEAATNSLKVRTQQNIDELIDRVIDGKIKENQLSNCNITFSDVDKIKEILKKKIQNMYHVRIEYPVIK